MTGKCLRCTSCDELFCVHDISHVDGLSCPNCGSLKIGENTTCTLAAGPPPWEFVCSLCQTRFNVTVPRGPEEASQIHCPSCRSREVRWMRGATDKCPPTGG